MIQAYAAGGRGTDCVLLINAPRLDGSPASSLFSTNVSDAADAAGIVRWPTLTLHGLLPDVEFAAALTSTPDPGAYGPRAAQVPPAPGTSLPYRPSTAFVPLASFNASLCEPVITFETEPPKTVSTGTWSAPGSTTSALRVRVSYVGTPDPIIAIAAAVVVEDDGDVVSTPLPIPRGYRGRTLPSFVNGTRQLATLIDGSQTLLRGANDSPVLTFNTLAIAAMKPGRKYRVWVRTGGRDLFAVSESFHGTSVPYSVRVVRQPTSAIGGGGAGSSAALQLAVGSVVPMTVKATIESGLPAVSAMVSAMIVRQPGRFGRLSPTRIDQAATGNGFAEYSLILEAGEPGLYQFQFASRGSLSGPTVLLNFTNEIGAVEVLVASAPVRGLNRVEVLEAGEAARRAALAEEQNGDGAGAGAGGGTGGDGDGQGSLWTTMVQPVVRVRRSDGSPAAFKRVEVFVDNAAGTATAAGVVAVTTATTITDSDGVLAFQGLHIAQGRSGSVSLRFLCDGISSPPQVIDLRNPLDIDLTSASKWQLTVPLLALSSAAFFIGTSLHSHPAMLLVAFAVGIVNLINTQFFVRDALDRIVVDRFHLAFACIAVTVSAGMLLGIITLLVRAATAYFAAHKQASHPEARKGQHGNVKHSNDSNRNTDNSNNTNNNKNTDVGRSDDDVEAGHGGIFSSHWWRENGWPHVGHRCVRDPALPAARRVPRRSPRLKGYCCRHARAALAHVSAAAP
jgi:hypothetical protein